VAFLEAHSVDLIATRMPSKIITRQKAGDVFELRGSQVTRLCSVLFLKQSCSQNSVAHISSCLSVVSSQNSVARISSCSFGINSAMSVFAIDPCSI